MLVCAHALVLLIGITAPVLWTGRQQYLRERTTIYNGQWLKVATERQLAVTEGDPALHLADVQPFLDAETRINPYTGQRTRECSAEPELCPGDFAYIIVLSNGRLESNAIVTFSPLPTLPERLYALLVQPLKLWGTPDLKGLRPCVKWAGGECGNCYVFHSRGLPVSAAMAEINAMYQPEYPLREDQCSVNTFFTTQQYHELVVSGKLVLLTWLGITGTAATVCIDKQLPRLRQIAPPQS